MIEITLKMMQSLAINNNSNNNNNDDSRNNNNNNNNNNFELFKAIIHVTDENVSQESKRLRTTKQQFLSISLIFRKKLDKSNLVT